MWRIKEMNGSVEDILCSECAQDSAKRNTDYQVFERRNRTRDVVIEVIREVVNARTHKRLHTNYAGAHAKCNNKCVYCGGINHLSVDHVRPYSLGGTNDPRNLVVACRACNNFAQAFPFESYLEKKDYILDRRQTNRLSYEATT